VTTPTARRIWFEVDAQVYLGSWTDLPVTRLVASMDMDRVNFTAATLTLDGATAATWAALDPQAQDPLSFSPVRFRARQYEYDAFGAPLIHSYLPGSYGGFSDDSYALLWIRTIDRDYINGRITVDLGGSELMMADKRRIATTVLPTGATTVAGLVNYSIGDVFGGGAVTNDAIVLSTTIPSGDRRDMLQGESHIDLIRPELDAIGCRLYDYWGILFANRARDIVGGTIKLATYTEDEGAPSDADPIVTGLRETVTRDADYADAVLVKGTYTDTSGNRIEWYDRSGTGVNTKGRVISVERAQPAGSIADEFATRTIIRGHDINVQARARLDVRPANALEVHHRAGVLEGNIRAVEYDIDAMNGTATMRLRAQTGEAIE
jgi:hypothetical protein